MNATGGDVTCSFSPLPSSSLGWHIGAIFFVLAASAVGVFLPLLLSRAQSPDRFKVALVVGKHIGTGALLSLGFIHLLFPAIEQLGNECLGVPWTDYPFALLFAMLAAMLMHLGEVVSHAFVHRADSGDENHATRIDIERPTHSQKSIEGDFHESEISITKEPLPPMRLAGHNHGVLLHSREEEMVSALLLEGGLAVHSVIIGIALGIAEERELAALIPALSFHQLFEGLAMGSHIGAVGFKSWKSVVLALIYTLSAPVGVAIGIGIRSTYNPSSPSASLSQGILDAISGGIILYSGFVTMLAYEFAADFHEFKDTPVRVSMFIGLWLGAGILSLIGIWL